VHNVKFYSVAVLLVSSLSVRSWQPYQLAVFQLAVGSQHHGLRNPLPTQILPTANCLTLPTFSSEYSHKIKKRSDLVKNKKTETVLQNLIFPPLRREQ